MILKMSRRYPSEAYRNIKQLLGARDKLRAKPTTTRFSALGETVLEASSVHLNRLPFC